MAQNRRSFLKSTIGLGLASPLFGEVLGSPASASGSQFDPDFGTAQQAARAIRTGVISSRELTAHVFERIEAHNPKINAFVTLAKEQAMERANAADEALAAGHPWGPLHGLPVVLKDNLATAGIRTTAGSKKYEKTVPSHDAVPVARIKNAGAIIVGKTNLPEFGGDVQTYNDVAGTTNNPWDLKRTPGGSTGGGGAALAAGFGFLEIGNDIGGSIRTPSNFCGVYGHKPTLNLVSRVGNMPPDPGTVGAALSDLSVNGPLARSAQDLRLELEIIGGPAPTEAVAYSWRLPAPRGSSLSDYRIGYTIDDRFCPVTGEVLEVLERAIRALEKAGARLERGWPEGVNPGETFELYFRLLGAAFSASEAQREELEETQHTLREAKNYLDGVTISHERWKQDNVGRYRARAAWSDWFQDHDVFLMPVTFTPAFLHDHNPKQSQRWISTPKGKRNYIEMFKWISFATLTGCPATVAPVGLTRSGLPVGLQIMGPYLEDATPIDIAGRLADLIGGFQRPPGL